MRGESGRSLLRLLIYPLLLAVLPPIAGAAYPGSGTLPTFSLPATPPSNASHSSTTRPARIAGVEVSARPVPPIATLPEPTALDQLKSDLATIAGASGGRVGISVQELSGPRRTSLSINGEQSFYAASAYKLPLLMAEAQQVASGQASPADQLCYDPSDQEDGWFTDYGPGSCFTREDLAQRTGLYSDNTAAHILVRYLGGPDALNAYARAAGMVNSALWIPNTTTPEDLAAAWVNEALGRMGGSGAQQWLYPLLMHTVNEQGISAGVPAGVSVVHKVGTFTGSENDAAYVSRADITYVIAVAVDGTDEATGWSTIAQVSSRVWRYESSRPGYVPVASATPAPPLWPDRRH